MAESKSKNTVMRFAMIFMMFMYIILSSSYTVQSIKYIGENQFFSGDDCFYIININENKSCLYRFDSSGSSSKIFSDNYLFTDAYIDSNYIYLFSQTKSNLVLTAVRHSDNKKKIIMLSDLQLRDRCISTDASGRIYAVDKRSANTVHIYAANGDESDEVNVFDNISSLFYDSENDLVFAVMRDGLYNIKEHRKISSTIPEYEYDIRRNLCTDGAGNVYRFDHDKGFEKILSLHYSVICLAEDFIYAADGNMIYQLDDTGAVQAYCDTGKTIDRLLASGNMVAYVSGNNIDILKTQDMDDIPVISEQTQTTKSTSAAAPQNSDVLLSANYDIQSSEVEIANEFIFIDKDMTLAKLKKSIDYHDNTLTVKNHSGKEVTSGKIGTNWQLTFSGEITETYYTVLNGDITGEGSINSRDLNLLCDYLFDQTELSPAQAFAADIDENEEINLLDMYILYQNT